jgi:hypothetical protein
MSGQLLPMRNPVAPKMLVIGSLCGVPCFPTVFCEHVPGYILAMACGLPAGFLVRRGFAPRRLFDGKELMTLLVVVNMDISSRLDRSAAHKLLVLAVGIRWQRCQLMVREYMG